MGVEARFRPPKVLPKRLYIRFVRGELEKPLSAIAVKQYLTMLPSP